jgi:hypothetical protein
MAAISLLHRNINGAIRLTYQRKDRRKPAAFVNFGSLRGLFGRVLPRRIECARIVDRGDLVVREAEHLAQDLVGVFAEQRGVLSSTGNS